MKPEIGKRYVFTIGWSTRTGTVLAIKDGLLKVCFDDGHVDWEREDSIRGGA